jgi:hypothetical protein
MHDDRISRQPVFEITENAIFTPAPILRVLKGEIAGAIFRRYATVDVSERLLERFRASPDLKQRSGDASGSYIGAFHWQKTLPQYLREASFARSAIDRVLGSAGNPWDIFVTATREALACESVELRRAQWNGNEASAPIIRSWEGKGEFGLVPHEDLAQCLDPQQRAFEIQSVPDFAVCSANLCFANEGGGDLIMWNYIPSVEDRRRFRTEYTGGPYPPGALAAYPRIDLTINSGDLYVFNGAFVHAVGATVGFRATASCLLGHCDSNSVVMWT